MRMEYRNGEVASDRRSEHQAQPHEVYKVELYEGFFIYFNFLGMQDND